jgi:hypothetical protein
LISNWIFFVIREEVFQKSFLTIPPPMIFR